MATVRIISETDTAVEFEVTATDGVSTISMPRTILQNGPDVAERTRMIVYNWIQAAKLDGHTKLSEAMASDTLRARMFKE